jgi:ribosomal protein L24E
MSYFLQTAIGQNDGATLDWIQENFGGGVYRVKRDGSYFWTITNKNSYLFLKKIVPYLRYKKPQAEMAIKFYEEIIIPRRHKKFGEKVTSEQNKKREWYYWEMRRLKKVFTKSPCNGVKKSGFND